MSKNVLYIKSPTKPWADMSEYVSDEYGWTPKLWVGAEQYKGELEGFGKTQVDYYTHEDAMMALCPEFLNITEPLDAEMLEAFSSHQPVFHEMVNRWFINPDRASYKSRAQYYNRMIEVWINIFKHHEIDLVIGAAIPHRVYDYVAYMVAQHLDVPYLMIDGTAAIHLNDGEMDYWPFFIDRIEDRMTYIYERFKAKKSKIKISKNTQEYADRVRGDYEGAKPKYLDDKDVKAASRPLKDQLKDNVPFIAKVLVRGARDLIDGRFNTPINKYEFQPYFKSSTRNIVEQSNRFKASLYHRRIYKQTEAAKIWLEEHSEPLSTDAPYVLFTASKQPERSTCPDSGPYYNHFDIIASVASVLPEGWKIYYKEHPSNYRKPWVMDSQRSPAFYEALQEAAPQLVFLPLQSDPFSCMDGAQAIVTATSSSAWEGVLRGIPALIFGSVWYENCPGVFKVSNTSDAQAALKQVQKGMNIDQDELLKFVEFFKEIGKDIQWRREPNFGAPADNEKLYQERIVYHAEAFKEALERIPSEVPQKAVKVRRAG